MTQSKAGSYTFLPDSAFVAEAKATADVIQSLAGRTRCEYELLTGASPGADTFATPLNPDARHGHNHRGPPWGSAFLHPVAWCGGKQVTNVDLQGERQVMTVVAGTATNPAVGRLMNWVIWCAPFADLPAPRIAPYRKLYLGGLGYLDSATTTDVAVRVRARDFGEDTAWVEKTWTFTSTTEQVPTAPDGNPFVLVKPGYTCIDLTVSNQTAREVRLTSIALLQVVKRSHV